MPDSFAAFDSSHATARRGADENEGHGAAVARAFKRAVADYEIEMNIRVK